MGKTRINIGDQGQDGSIRPEDLRDFYIAPVEGTVVFPYDLHVNGGRIQSNFDLVTVAETDLELLANKTYFVFVSYSFPDYLGEIVATEDGFGSYGNVRIAVVTTTADTITVEDQRAYLTPSFSVDDQSLNASGSGVRVSQVADDTSGTLSGRIALNHKNFQDLAVWAPVGTAADNVRVHDGLVRRGNSVSYFGGVTIAPALPDGSNYIEYDKDSGTIETNQVGYTDGRLPLGVVSITAGLVTGLSDDRALLSISSGGAGGDVLPANVPDLRPTDEGGLDVTVAAGKIAFGSNYVEVPQYDLTLEDDAIIYIELRPTSPSNAQVVAHNNNALEGFTPGSWPIAEVHTSSGDIIQFHDRRTIFQTLERDAEQFGLNWSASSFDIVINAGSVNSLGKTYDFSANPDAYGIASENFTLVANSKYLVYLRSSKFDATWYIDIVDSNITNPPVLPTKNDVALWYIETDATAISFIKNLRTAYTFIQEVHPENVGDFAPAINGAQVHVAAGRLRVKEGDSGSGIRDIAAQDVTPSLVDENGNDENVVSYICILQDGTTAVFPPGGFSGIAPPRGSFVVARATVTSNVIILLEDMRSIFVTDRAFDDFDAVWTRDSLDITVKAGYVRKLGGRVSGQYRLLAVEQTFNLSANTHYAIYLDQESDDSRHVDIKIVVIGNIDNVGFSSDFFGTPIYLVSTNATGVDGFYDLRQVQNILGENPDHFRTSDDWLEFRFAPNSPLIARQRVGDDLGQAGLDLRDNNDGGGIEIRHIMPISYTHQVGSGLTGNNIRTGVVMFTAADGTTTVVTVPDQTSPDLEDDATNYMQVDDTGVVYANITGYDKGSLPIATIVTAAGVVTSVTDTRPLFSVVKSHGTPVDNETPTGTLDSVNTDFTLANTPIANSEHVYLNGLRQRGGGNDYDITGDTISFTVAPDPGDVILVDYRF